MVADGWWVPGTSKSYCHAPPLLKGLPEAVRLWKMPQMGSSERQPSAWKANGMRFPSVNTQEKLNLRRFWRHKFSSDIPSHHLHCPREVTL